MPTILGELCHSHYRSKRKYSSWNQVWGLPSSTLLLHMSLERQCGVIKHTAPGASLLGLGPQLCYLIAMKIVFLFPHLSTRDNNNTCSGGVTVKNTWVTLVKTPLQNLILSQNSKEVSRKRVRMVASCN